MKISSATLRKQRQRRRMAASGVSRMELEITAQVRGVLDGVVALTGGTSKAAASAILRRACKAYLAEVQQAKSVGRPVWIALKEYELYRNHLLVPGANVRVGDRIFTHAEHVELTSKMDGYMSRMKARGWSAAEVIRMLEAPSPAPSD